MSATVVIFPCSYLATVFFFLGTCCHPKSDEACMISAEFFY